LNLDIGLYEEFNNLRQVIESQNKTIEKLREDIRKQGLSGGNNDQ
jgi:hypothetical protein